MLWLSAGTDTRRPTLYLYVGRRGVHSAAGSCDRRAARSFFAAPGSKAAQRPQPSTRRSFIASNEPRVNEAVNEEWISDKTRHVVDGLRSQRLDQPLIHEGGRLRAASWSEAFAVIAERIKAATPGRIGAIAGDLATVEEMFALKDLMTRLGSKNIDARQDGAAIDPTWGRATYLFNATIAGIEQADALLIIGSNPRKEAAVLNARIRKRWRAGKFPIGVIGEKANLTYSYDHLGAGPETLASLGEHEFGKTLKAAERPLLLVGAGALARKDGAGVAALAAKTAGAVGAVKDGWNGFSVLQNAASRVGALDIGFVPGQGGFAAAEMAKAKALDVLVLLGADEIDIEPGAFVVYIGSHGDAGAHRANVVLPGAAYPEKSGIYANTEGRVQLAGRAAFPPGDAREDWAIVRALSNALGRTLPYDSLNTLRKAVFAAHPHLSRIDQIEQADPSAIGALAKLKDKTDRAGFVSPVEDFYFTNPIARASTVMAECSAIAEGAAAMTAAE
jgi:NADH-quinone oxidoreductase subunit G